MAQRATDETGRQYGNLRVLGRAPAPKVTRGRPRPAYWLCKCLCGEECLVTGTNLRAGQKTCGACVGRLDLSEDDILRVRQMRASGHDAARFTRHRTH